MLSLNFVLTLSALSIALTSASPMVTNGNSDLEARQTGCTDVTVFFARGTGEAAPLGSIVGPPFSSALKTALPGKTISFVGVNYPADVAGFLAGGSPEGAANMANGVTSTASKCPQTKIVISGYSQGAQVTHLAAQKLSTDVQNRVAAAVVFGDPKKGQGFPGVINGRSITFCATGDLICTGSSIILPAHLGYGADTPAAASFVSSHV